MLLQTGRLMIQTMRPRQWLKNLLIFVPLVFDQQLTNWPALLRTVAGFALLCLVASTVYIINDLADLESDRSHPKKRLRPLPSGQLAVPLARWLAIALLAISFPLAYLLSSYFFLVLLGYFLLNLAYSRWLKHIPIIDVFVLASFYLLRIVAGLTLIHVARFSPWLYVVTSLGALYIGFGKRRAELSLLAEEANAHRKVLEGYTIPLLDQFITIVSATTIGAYSLYTFSAPNLPDNHAMMLTIPFVIYGIFRYMYIVNMEQGGGAPEEDFLTDRPLQVTILLWGVTVLTIFYLF